MRVMGTITWLVPLVAGCTAAISGPPLGGDGRVDPASRGPDDGRLCGGEFACPDTGAIGTPATDAELPQSESEQNDEEHSEDEEEIEDGAPQDPGECPLPSDRPAPPECSDRPPCTFTLVTNSRHSTYFWRTEEDGDLEIRLPLGACCRDGWFDGLGCLLQPATYCGARECPERRMYWASVEVGGSAAGTILPDSHEFVEGEAGNVWLCIEGLGVRVSYLLRALPDGTTEELNGCDLTEGELDLTGTFAGEWQGGPIVCRVHIGVDG